MKYRLLTGSFVTMALLCSLGLARPGMSMAQDQATPVAAAPGAATITVNGTGTVTIEPDSAVITLGVYITGDTLVQAQEDSATQMQTVLDTLSDAKVPDDLIQTTSYSINVVNEFDDNGNIKGVSGYQVTNQVQATITDLDGLGALIDELVANGANSINGIQFMTSDATEALSQARLLAVADAKAKASELAKAAGGKLGEIISISESSIGAGPVAKGAFTTAQDATTTPIQSGSLQIQISVTITYGMN
ncbi:hypothetical protein BH09CHL1_BH09CHL1_23500 [soil metagenome]